MVPEGWSKPLTHQTTTFDLIRERFWKKANQREMLLRMGYTFTRHGPPDFFFNLRGNQMNNEYESNPLTIVELKDAIVAKIMEI